MITSHVFTFHSSYPDLESRAALRRIRHADRALMRLDDAVHDRETEPSPVVLGREERIEDLVENVRRNTWTTVANDDVKVAGTRVGRWCAEHHGDAAADRGGIRRVQEKVEQRLADEHGINRHRQRRRPLYAAHDLPGEHRVVRQLN